MRSVALVIVVFSLLASGIGMIEALAVPSAPMNLVATAGVLQVGLAWQAPLFNEEGYPITNYRVYRGTAPGTAIFLTDAGASLSYTDTAVMAGQIYYYQVSAENGFGEGPRSNEASATPTAPTAPTAPQNLVATAGAVQVGLTWQAPLSDGGSPITNYVVYRDTAPGAAFFLADAGTSLSYTDTAVIAGQIYYYQVSAENSIGESLRSNEASATPTAPTAPTAPQNLVATAGAVEVGLTWQAPLSDGGSPITNYRVYRGTAPGTATFLADAGTSLSYTDMAVMADQTYYYQVSAENSIGESPRSNEAVAMRVVEIQILAPQAGQTVSTLGFRLQVSVANFTLDPASIDQADNPGHGHYHIWVNDTFTGVMSGDPIVDLSNFPVGPMKLGVELVTNMHASLSPPVWHNITVTVVAPSITLTHPADGGPVSTQGAQFQVDVQGLELDNQNLGGNPIPGHGHYHVFVDGSFTGTTPTEPTFTIPSFTPGSHTVKVDLRTNNHQLLSPTVEDMITVTAADPSISIVEPTAGATVGPVVSLRVQIAGFTIDAESVGQANVPGRGHYHVTVDGTTIDFMVTGLIYAVKDLAEGQRTIRVSLHNNDHSAVTPEVTDEVTVTVATPTSPPAGVDSALFAGTTIGLIALLIVVAVVLFLWGRKGRQAP